MPRQYTKRPSEERFWSKVVFPEDSDCWLWAASINNNGYGEFWAGDKYVKAHRWAYEYLIGPIPAGLTIDHLCRNRACVNPAHLEPVTLRINLLRGNTFQARNAAKTHCESGHSFDLFNTCLLYTSEAAARVGGMQPAVATSKDERH